MKPFKMFCPIEHGNNPASYVRFARGYVLLPPFLRQLHQRGVSKNQAEEMTSRSQRLPVRGDLGAPGCVTFDIEKKS